MAGPLPNPQRRRRNAPAIPGTQLPAGGYDGPVPECPYDLAKAGRAWWAWAWRTPQAAAWDDGSLYGLARRAQLEDEMAVAREVEPFDLRELLQADEQDLADRVGWLIRDLKARASGTSSLMREMRELDNRFGLNAKAMADLRWTIVEPEAEKPAAAGSTPRLRAV